MTRSVDVIKSTIVRSEAVEIRPLLPSDVALVEAMSADVSARSLAQRFFAGTPAIPRAMLAHLRALDRTREEAVIAVLGGRAVGLAEYVALRGAAAAEIAVLVADRWQHAGIGRRMVALLAGIAESRGITHFTASVLADNLPARRAVATLWPTGVYTYDEDCLEFVLPLRTATARRRSRLSPVQPRQSSPRQFSPRQSSPRHSRGATPSPAYRL